jgi:hypothetical protein
LKVHDTVTPLLQAANGRDNTNPSGSTVIPAVVDHSNVPSSSAEARRPSARGETIPVSSPATTIHPQAELSSVTPNSQMPTTASKIRPRVPYPSSKKSKELLSQTTAPVLNFIRQTTPSPQPVLSVSLRITESSQSVIQPPIQVLNPGHSAVQNVQPKQPQQAQSAPPPEQPASGGGQPNVNKGLSKKAERRRRRRLAAGDNGTSGTIASVPAPISALQKAPNAEASAPVVVPVPCPPVVTPAVGPSVAVLPPPTQPQIQTTPTTPEERNSVVTFLSHYVRRFHAI